MDKSTKELAEQERLLRIEFEEEKAAFAELADRIGVHRLAERGNAWFPLEIGRSWYNSLNQRVVEIEREAGEDAEAEADHSFEYGRQVQFFSLSGDIGAKPRRHFTGTVSIVDGNRMVIVIPEHADLHALEAGGRAGLMLSFDETSYKAMFEALAKARKADGRTGRLRDLIYSGKSFGELTGASMRFPYLNTTQQEAVNKVLRAKDVAIVHGPPGTGKTTTLVEAIHETLMREPQVLVCAQSNMAVDWISEQLTDRGINVMRIGNPSRVNDKMLSFTYERRFESHPDYPTLWSIRKAIRDLYASHKRGENRHQKIERLKERATELELRINAELFNDARVIACTLVGSSSRILQGMKFPTLFIDEAAQALEGAAWIPLLKAGRLILAGDHRQLPATVKSYEAMRQGLGRSLMERIAETHPEAVTLLTMQYRMHEEIMRFSSDEFYDGRMTAAPEVAHRSILDLDTPIEWIDTAEERVADAEIQQTDRLEITANAEEETFREQVTGAGFGRINREEAQLAVEVLKRYAEKIGISRLKEERTDFGVISPYRAQVRYLRRLISRDKELRPLRDRISVNTVDGFQGQERDVMLISMVRSNENGNIGFLGDLRRMNVAMTRARMKLIIIGDRETLCHHRFYRRLYDYIKSLSAGQHVKNDDKDTEE